MMDYLVKTVKNYNGKKLNHPPINFGKTGVLIINLGTPDLTSWFDIRKYLKEFLSDKRVIEVNLLFGNYIKCFYIKFKTIQTAKAYKEIWMKEENISPLLYYIDNKLKIIKLNIRKKYNY